MTNRPVHSSENRPTEKPGSADAETELFERLVREAGEYEARLANLARELLGRKPKESEP